MRFTSINDFINFLKFMESLGFKLSSTEEDVRRKFKRGDIFISRLHLRMFDYVDTISIALFNNEGVLYYEITGKKEEKSI